MFPGSFDFSTFISTSGAADEIAAVESCLKNIMCQADTRKVDVTETNPESTIKVVRCNEEFSQMTYIEEVTEIVACVEGLLAEKRTALEAKDSHWTKFKSTEKSLASALQEVLQKVQLITVDSNTLDSLRKAADAVTVLSESCSGIKSLKEEYNELGRHLIQLEPSKARVIQDTVLEANKKWEKISNLLNDQNNKSRCLIFLWEQCVDIKNELLSDLASAEEGSNVLNSVPQSSKDVADLTDKTKKSIEIVKKCRYPFESFYKKQSQLIQELSTVPKFDVSPLKTDLTDVQKKFTVLGNALTAKLNSLESQAELWKEVDLLFDNFENALNETEVEMRTLDIADYELCKLKLGKIEVALKSLKSKEAEVQAKIGVLGSMNETGSMPDHSARLAKLSQDLEDMATKHSEVTEVISGVGEAWVKLKQQITDLSKALDELKDPLQVIKKT